MNVKEVSMNDDDNGQEEDKDERGVNNKEENQEPVNEEGIYNT